MLDDCQRPDENPLSFGGRWSGVFSGNTDNLKLLSHNIRAQAARTDDAYWLSQFSSDTEAYATISIKATTAGDGVNVVCRIENPSATQDIWDGYEFMSITQAGVDEFRMRRVDNDVATNLASVFQEYVVGDKVGIRCVGSNIQGWRFDSVAGTWSQLVSVTDATYRSSGFVGLRIRGTVGGVSSFGGGSVGQSKPQIYRWPRT